LLKLMPGSSSNLPAHPAAVPHHSTL